MNIAPLPNFVQLASGTIINLNAIVAVRRADQRGGTLYFGMANASGLIEMPVTPHELIEICEVLGSHAVRRE